MTESTPAFAPVSATLRLRFLDFRVRVDTNSLRLASRLQSYFAAYLDEEVATPDARLDAIVGAPEYDAARMEVWSRPSSPGRRPKESFYDEAGVRRILKNRTGVLITLSERGASIAGDLEEHVNQVVNLIGTLFGLSLIRHGYVMLHASAVADAETGEAIAFLGNSGSGKSSLALQLVERGGYDFLSNDRIFLKAIDDGVTIVGLPKKPRVNPGTLLASAALSRLVVGSRRHAYEQLPADELWHLEEKTDIDVEDHLGARSKISARLGHLYSLEWRRSDEGLRQESLDVDGAMAAMRVTSKDYGPYDRRDPGGPVEAEMERIARLVPFMRITGKADPRGLAEHWRAGSAERRYRRVEPVGGAP